MIDRRIVTVDRFALPALLILAAALRLPDLATRGTWDGDQGHDMLVLRTLVRDGVLPLLGPPTSIGDVHHGAWYYYLLAPAAAVTGGDAPLAVVALIAVAGIAAVRVVWWLAKSVGGPVAGLVAGLLMATSAAAIDESTFIWNPNLIALSSATAVAAAWRAWSGGDRRWWLVAAAGTAVTMQCHVLGIALLPIVGAPLVADARRRSLGWVPIGILAILAAAYAPLVINELTTDFSELRAATEYLGGGREAAERAIPVRFGIVLLRVVSWPLTGLIIDGFVAAALATFVVIAIVAWRWRARDDRDRFVVRWFGLGLLWSVAFLTVAAPSLAVVVRGLPNDHYHAFADPLVFVLLGLGAAALMREVRAPIGAAATAGLVLALVGWNVTHLPPPVHPDGGFPAADATAGRIDMVLSPSGADRDEAITLVSLPGFKSPEAVAYTLIRNERVVVGALPNGELVPGTAPARGNPSAAVILCDQLFREAIGADCGGPAEEDLATSTSGLAALVLLDRFEAAPGRWVSVYAAPSP